MLLSLLPSTVWAAGTGEETVDTECITVDTSDADLPSNDELFAGYVQQLMYPQYGVSLFANFGESTLSGLDKTIYDKLKEKIKSVADGTLASSEFLFTWSELGITKTTWTKTELGVEIVTGGSINPAAQSAVMEKIGYNPDKISDILNLLLVNCPYELYWFDKTEGITKPSGVSVTASYGGSTEDSISLKEGSGLTFTFKVSKDYAAGGQTGTTSVDTSKTGATKSAIAQASQIVADNASKSDYEKLVAYKEKICELVSYNTTAATTNPPYGDPWQIIYVFDGDEDTNVVCEGYAKAFQYLCDLSTFTDGTVCYTVTGGIPGAHMWNIVTLGGKNYLVDVTNCDDGTVGSPDKLFLAGTTKSGDSYTFNFSVSNSITYTYDDDTKTMYDGSGILDLAAGNYTPSKSISGTVSINGTPKIGVELTANTDQITASDKSTPSAFTYQWYRGNTAIDSATSKTYTPTTTDVGQTIKVVVTADGYTGSVTSAPTAAVEKKDAPNAPSTPTATATYNSITVDSPDGKNEYACVKGDAQPSDWQSTGTFTGLTASTAYKIYARVAETEDTKASDASAPLTVTTKAAPISAVTVSDLDSPAKGSTLDTAVTVTPSGVTTTVTWYKGNTATGEAVTGAAAANQVYTVKITLTAGADQSFADSVTAADGYSVQRTSNTEIILTKTFPATAAKTVQSIAVSGSYKTEYVEGEKFDPTGMVVTATYDDKSTAPVIDYTVSPETLAADTTEVTVTYEGQTAKVSGIKVLKKPTAADFDITLPTDATYDGNSKTATIKVKSAVSGMGTVTIKYNGNTTVPTDAGTYQVTFDVAKGTDYAAATGLVAGTFSIAKATPIITVDSSKVVVINAPISLGATIDPSSLTLSYKSNNDSIATVDDSGNVTGKTVDNTTITVFYAGNNNYNPAEKIVSVTVTDKTPVSVTFNDATSQQYSEGGYKLGDQFAAATVAGGQTITGYKYNGQNYDTLDKLPNVTAVGTYTVTAYYESATEYGEDTATFQITKANQDTLTINSATSVTFGDALPLTATGGSGTGAVTFLVQDGTGSATISNNILTPTKAGTVKVTATKAADNNYHAATSAEITITIDKADATEAMKTASGTIMANQSGSVTLSLPEGATATIKGSSPVEVTKAAISGSTLTYTGSADVKDGTKYTVTLSVSESTNYNAYEITVTLTGTDKLTPTLSVNPIVVTYTGSQVPATAITGTAKVGDIVVPGTWKWSTAAVPPTNVSDSGSYDVFFEPTDSATYAVAFGKVQVTINKATPTGTPKYTAINTSGKTLADAGLTTDGGTFSVSGTVAWELASTTQVQPNTYYKWIFTPNSSNYTQLTGTIELWHRSSSGGSSSGGSSSSGTQTDTTKNPDGSTTTTVTKPDGTVTTTNTDKNGNKTQTVEKPNGSTTTTVDKKDGSSSTTTVSAAGVVEATVDLSESAVVSAASQGQPVALPMPEVPVTTRRASAPTVTVNLPVGGTAQVEIPVENVTAGTVAILVKADGSEQVIKTSLTTDNGVAVTLKDGDTVKIVDNSKTFYDVPSYYWGANAIDFATSREIFSGTGGNSFAPEMTMNRAMIVTVLAAYEGVNTTSNTGVWYDVGRQWAMERGITDGSNMEASLTREQLATMLWRYAGSPVAGNSLSGYVDSGSVSDYAVQAMAWAVENGLISGVDGNALAPQGNASRAQVATILMRFVESQNG